MVAACFSSCELPGSSYISTPVGKYGPDWATAFNKGSVKHIFFVAETKGSLDIMELRGVENAKDRMRKNILPPSATTARFIAWRRIPAPYFKW